MQGEDTDVWWRSRRRRHKRRQRSRLYLKRRGGGSKQERWRELASVDAMAIHKQAEKDEGNAGRCFDFSFPHPLFARARTVSV